MSSLLGSTPVSDSLQDEQNDVINFHGNFIKIVPFLFPLQIEPDCEAFRVDYCDRLLNELHAAQRAYRVRQLRNLLSHSGESSEGPTINGRSSNLAQSGVLSFMQAKHMHLSTLSSPMTTSNTNDDKNTSSRSCLKISSILGNNPLSLFRSPSTCCSDSTAGPLTNQSPAVQCTPNLDATPDQERTTTYLKKKYNELVPDMDRRTVESQLFLSLSPDEKNGYQEALSADSKDADEDELHWKSPALRYGRNSGYRRLEDMRRRIQESFQSSVITILEEEMNWALHVGSVLSRMRISAEINSWNESKMFYFGKMWWMMQFGIRIGNSMDSQYCYFQIAPAELVTKDIRVSAEFCVYPPQPLSSLSPNYSALERFDNVYCRRRKEELHFLPALVSTPAPMQGIDQFIHIDALRGYVTDSGIVRVGVILRSGVDRLGNLLGCSFEK